METTVDKNMYLHVGPSGDFWTAGELFAAKHLQPDYVKSVKLDESIDQSLLLELLESAEGYQWTQSIYDDECLPPDLLEMLKKPENGG